MDHDWASQALGDAIVKYAVCYKKCDNLETYFIEQIVAGRIRSTTIC